MILFLIILLGFSTANSAALEVQLSLFGGWNRVFEYGEEEDYVMGENDFPVTPAHSSFNFGGAVSIFFTPNLGLELDGRYVLPSEVGLQDPSDLDTVEIDTAKHYALTLNLVYRFLGRRLSPYVLVGGGFDKLLAEEGTYISEYGFEMEFVTPEKTTNAVANIGGGIQFFLFSNLGARFDVRYSVIFDDPHNQRSLSAALGLLLGF